MPPILFNNLAEKDKSAAVKKLICESSPRADFFLMVILSILMATFGLLLDSASVVIGSMLIAPILFSVSSLALGVVLSDFKLISRSFYTILKSVAFGVAAAATVSVFFNLSPEVSVEQRLLLQMKPSLLYASVALVAGLAASFAVLKPQFNEMLSGVAVSVALIPPLAATGIGISRFDWLLISNSFMLFLINTFGIVFASVIVFSLMNLYLKRKVVKDTVKKEEIKMKKEEAMSHEE